MSNEFFTNEHKQGRGITPSINVTKGLAADGWKSVDFAKLQRGDAQRTFGYGGSWTDPSEFGGLAAITPKFDANPSMLSGLSDMLGTGFDKLSTGLDKVGGLAEIGGLLEGYAAYETAGLRKRALKDARKAQAFNEATTTKNFNDQALTHRTYTGELFDIRNDRKGVARNSTARDAYVDQYGIKDFEGA